jgi:tol-pal system protein YbgF
MKRRLAWLLGIAGVALSSCVPPQQIDLIEREQRRLRSENASVMSEVAATRNEMDVVRSNLADARANIQQMRRELSALKERLDETRYQVGREIGQSSRVGDQRIKDLETRFAKLDEELKTQGTLLQTREEELRQLREEMQSAPRTAESATSTSPESPTNTTAEASGEESDAVKKDYEAARGALESKDYRGAIGQFREFLKKHPKSNLADNAQYWIGECYYALREFDQAILEFDTVRRKYPRGDKVPGALLKQGFAFAELGDKIDARLILKELTDRYPQSPEAVKAVEKLKALES